MHFYKFSNCDSNGDPAFAAPGPLPDGCYSLLPGRHPIPGNPPAVLAGWDFNPPGPVPCNLAELQRGEDDAPAYIDLPHNIGSSADEPLHLVVTGLTPALLFVLDKMGGWGRPYIVLWHYDKEHDAYWPQLAPTLSAYLRGAQDRPAIGSPNTDYDGDWDDTTLPRGARPVRGGW